MNPNQDRIDEINARLEEIKERLEVLESGDNTDEYDEMIDDCYSFKGVGGPFEHMSPSRVLKEVDEIAYNCGINDYNDSEISELNNETQDLEEELKALNEEAV